MTALVRFHGEARHDRRRPRLHGRALREANFEPEPGGEVFSGSHLDAVGKRRVTLVYGAADTQKVVGIARGRGVKPSAIYGEALDYYLAAQSRGIGAATAQREAPPSRST